MYSLFIRFCTVRIIHTCTPECMSNLFDLDVCDISMPADKETQINQLIASLPAEATEAKVALQELRVQGMV